LSFISQSSLSFVPDTSESIVSAFNSYPNEFCWHFLIILSNFADFTLTQILVSNRYQMNAATVTPIVEFDESKRSFSVLLASIL